MLAAELLMGASVVLMLAIAVFLVRVNRSVQRHHREQHGDLSHVRVPDDPSGLEHRRNRPKPPYRPL